MSPLSFDIVRLKTWSMPRMFSWHLHPEFRFFRERHDALLLLKSTPSSGTSHFQNSTLPHF